jgi:hypothetical protein
MVKKRVAAGLPLAIRRAAGRKRRRYFLFSLCGLGVLCGEPGPFFAIFAAFALKTIELEQAI